MVRCQENCIFDISECISAAIDLLPSPLPVLLPGTPRVDGFCGDGIINGVTEDCDSGAIQNTNCLDYGLSRGTVRCQPNCLYDMSDCR